MTEQPRIDAALLTHLGQLAHLQLPAEREAALRAKLQALVAAFSALDDADFGDLGDVPTSAPLNPDDLRSDQPLDCPPTDAVLRNAPQQAADSFVVPRVVEP